MARTPRIRKSGTAHYHVMSRTNDRRFLFRSGRVKRELVDILRRTAEFSGVRLEAYCLMDDHFHVVCRVDEPKAPVSEDEIVRRIGILKGGRFAESLSRRWRERRGCAMGAVVVDVELSRWRARMNDVSQFVKTFKELAGIAYKSFASSSGEGTRTYCGGIWSGRFKSTLVEGNEHLATCIRYVELNPVRAGMVERAEDYAYSSARAADGRRTCREEGTDPTRGEVGDELGGSIERRLESRIAQIAGGNVFGSLTFVSTVLREYGSSLASRPRPRRVWEDCYASHGHRLAAAETSFTRHAS